MGRLGPWGPAPRLGVGVSGGADSLALVLLADRWARTRGGSVHALIVDHGLRPAAAAEAAQTRAALTARRIAADIIALGLGRATAERARAARLAALEAACARRGLLHLLLGQHRLDQAETCVIRALDGSGAAGLAGMAPLRHGRAVRVLRPMLGLPPVALRGFVAAAGLVAVNDPSNSDPRATRARIRGLRADRDGDGAATCALVAAATARGAARGQAEAAIAAWLGCNAAIRPEGFALLPPGPWPEAALGRLMRAIGGLDYAPSGLAALAAAPRPVTRAGVRLMSAGRLGPGWMLVREAAAAALPAMAGTVWNRVWRVRGAWPAGATIGALGQEAGTDLPAAIRHVLPAVRAADGSLLAWGSACGGFAPADPVVGAPFFADGGPFGGVSLP